MEQVTNEPLVTFGCVMGKVRDNESDNISENLQDEVSFSFCYTSDNENDGLTFTSEMDELINGGYFLVAVAQFYVNDPKKFCVWVSRRFSAHFQSAFASATRDLVRVALSKLVINQGQGAGRMC